MSVVNGIAVVEVRSYVCFIYLIEYVSGEELIDTIGGELYESVGVEAPILLSYTHKNEWNIHGGPPTRCQRSAMGVSLIFVGVCTTAKWVLRHPHFHTILHL